MPTHTLKALSRWLNRPTAPAGRPRLSAEELGDRVVPASLALGGDDNGVVVAQGWIPRTTGVTYMSGWFSQTRTYIPTLTITGTDVADRVTVARDGTDVVVKAANAAGVRTARLTDVSANTEVWFRGRGGDDTLDASGVDLMVAAHGGAGNDTLRGGTGGDFLFGGEGNDDLYGNGGNDHLGRWISDGQFAQFTTDVETGKNRMWGGAGDDVVVGGPDLDAAPEVGTVKARPIGVFPGVVVPTDPLVLGPLPTPDGPALVVDGAAVVKP